MQPSNIAEIRKQQLKHRLEQALTPSTLEIKDDSARHAYHPGAVSGKSHFIIDIAAATFHGKSRLTCHRLIYQALDELMTSDIHSLRIRILSPQV